MIEKRDKMTKTMKFIKTKIILTFKLSIIKYVAIVTDGKIKI